MICFGLQFILFIDLYTIVAWILATFRVYFHDIANQCLKCVEVLHLSIAPAAQTLLPMCVSFLYCKMSQAGHEVCDFCQSNYHQKPVLVKANILLCIIVLCDLKKILNDVQKLTDKSIEKIDELLKIKKDE